MRIQRSNTHFLEMAGSAQFQTVTIIPNSDCHTKQ